MSKTEDKNGSHAICGLFFVGDVGNRKGHQGQVLSYVINGFYLVQFYGWSFGDPINCAVVPLTELSTAAFYSDHAEWVAAGEALSARNYEIAKAEAAKALAR